MRRSTLALLLLGLLLPLSSCSCDEEEPSPAGNNAENNASNNASNNANSDPGDTGEDDGGDNNAANNDAGGDTEPDVPIEVPTTGAYMAAKESDIDAVLQGMDLKYPVHVVRDELGIPHILAESMEDAIYVQGYLHALDRFPQMELIRATVNGTIARVAGGLSPQTIDGDIQTRVLAFRYMAQQILDSIDPSSPDGRALQAYAEGVNFFLTRFRAGQESLFPEAGLLVSPVTVQDWDVLDCLALVRYQQYTLSFDSVRELRKTQARMVAQEVFRADAEDPALAARVGILADMDRFAPGDPTYIVPGFTGAQKAGERPVRPQRPWEAPRREVLARALDTLDALPPTHRRWLAPEGRGLSNSWAITGALSATGNPVLANDPHLALDSPALFHQVHLVVEPREEADGPAVNAFGAIFPGLPGILIGHTERVAWALTTASYDYSDAYVEELVWTEGEPYPKVRRNGELIDVEVREEIIEIGGFGSINERRPIELLWVPGHGPLVPMIQNGQAVYPREDQGISYAWTGYSVSNEVKATMGFMTAQNLDDIHVALEDWVIGTQNLLFATADGDVFQTGHSYIPTRPPEAMDWDPDTNPGGYAPWWTLRGTGEHDWTGRLAEGQVPQVLNPVEGYVVTANNDQAGVTDDNNPLNDYAYVGYDWAIGFRAGRIKRRLANAIGEHDPDHKFSAEEVGAIQFDVHSTTGERLRPFLLDTLARAREEAQTPGTHPGLSAIVAANADAAARIDLIVPMLRDWDLRAADGMWGSPTPADIASSQAAAFFNVWTTLLLRRAFNDELAAAPGLEGGTSRYVKTALWLLEHPTDAATFDPALNDSILWDDLGTDAVTEDHHAIFMLTFFEAFPKMAELFGSEDPADWRWGKQHGRIFESIIPSVGATDPLTLPQPAEGFAHGFPRGGDFANVDRCDGSYTSFNYTCGGGPILRFLVELDPNGIKSWNTIPGGQVWDHRSPHFRDLLQLWLDNDRHPLYFHPADVSGHVTSHMVAVE